jgi:hypothetical protein
MKSFTTGNLGGPFALSSHAISDKAKIVAIINK